MAVDTMTRDRCENEDESGRRCKFGPGHAAKCQFRPFEASERQMHFLRLAEKTGTARLGCVGSTDLSVLRGLANRGFLRVIYINTRTYNIQLTAAGKRILIDAPR
jgi:hypothetical protein